MPRNNETKPASMILEAAYTLPKQMVERPKNGRIVDVYFDDAIECPDMFRELFQKIRTLDRSDELHLHVSCPGGDVNTTSGKTICNRR